MTLDFLFGVLVGMFTISFLITVSYRLEVYVTRKKAEALERMREERERKAMIHRMWSRKEGEEGPRQ